MESLRTSWLLDEFQQSLHSKNDYAAALEHTLGVCPELEEYMKEFQLVVTGDYPTTTLYSFVVETLTAGCTPC